MSKAVEGLSDRTLETYQQQLNLFTLYLGNPKMERISTPKIREFFNYLRTEYKPQRISGRNDPLTARTIRNYWICLRSFYSWANREFGAEDVLSPIPPPKPNESQTEPFSQAEIKAIADAAGKSPRKGRRNYAIILTLLDTGMRVTELCDLDIADVNLKMSKVIIQAGKGNKSRSVYIGEKTRQAIWRYLIDREEDPAAPLFYTQYRGRLSRHSVVKMVREVGERAQVRNCHPHRFRTTFATQYLRNGGDIFTLQILLGHTSLKMVRYYAKLAAIDAAYAHKKASPVDNWL